MRIATYNVKGVNGRLPVMLGWLKEATPDIVCLQELDEAHGGASGWSRVQNPNQNLFRVNVPRQCSVGVCFACVVLKTELRPTMGVVAGTKAAGSCAQL